MKVSRIVEQTNEYERLQRLIDNIESALESFEKTKDSDPNSSYSMGTVFMNLGSSFGVDSTGHEIKTVNVGLSSEVSEFIKYDMMDLLQYHLSALKNQQAELEI